MEGQPRSQSRATCGGREGEQKQTPPQRAKNPILSCMHWKTRDRFEKPKSHDTKMELLTRCPRTTRLTPADERQLRGNEHSIRSLLLSPCCVLQQTIMRSEATDGYNAGFRKSETFRYSSGTCWTASSQAKLNSPPSERRTTGGAVFPPLLSAPPRTL